MEARVCKKCSNETRESLAQLSARKTVSDFLVTLRSKDKTDLDVIREQNKFIWDDSEDLSDLSWEKRLAKRYYDKLFKEYCICDLTYFEQNKVS